jgi:hypothetical protein
MNILSIVFAILFMLSFAFYACLENQTMIHRLNKTFISQTNIFRKMLTAYETEIYKKTRASAKIASSKHKKKEEKNTLKEIPTPSKINPECARLNLWPLLQTGREENQLLYEELAQLLRQFYKKSLFSFFSDQTGLEYRFLDTWLASIKTSLSENPTDPVILEKIALTDKTLQMLYYNMLRGSKEKYPTLLDFVKVDQKTKDKLCLFHATPTMLSIFFGDAAQAVYEEIHGEKIVVTAEMIEEICRQHRAACFDKKFFEIITLARFKHDTSSTMTLLEEDPTTQISFRKKMAR